MFNFKKAVFWPLLFLVLTSSQAISLVSINGQPLHQVNDLNLLFNAGMVSVEKSQFKLSTHFFRRMLTINPTLHRPCLELARALEATW